MNEIRFHAAAEIFPMMGEAELRELADDIKQNGLVEPAVLYHGEILDGRNRIAACKLAGIEPRFTELNGDVPSPVLYVLSKNLHRRHLTASQRGAIAAEVVPMLADEKHRASLANLRNQVSTVPIGHIEGRAREIAAKATGVGERTVSRAIEVKKADSALFEKVKSGELTAWAASERIPKRKRERADSETPYQLDTKRKRVVAEAQKSKMITGLSTMTGLCRGLSGLDMRLALCVCDDEEKREWRDRAIDLAKQLRQFAAKF